MPVLQICPSDSLELQQKVLRHLEPCGVDATAEQRTQLPPMGSFTPHIPLDRVPRYQGMNIVDACTMNVTFSPQLNFFDVTNTSRILASLCFCVMDMCILKIGYNLSMGTERHLT